MFRLWCKEQGFVGGSRLSHVLMDGGVLSVPFERLNDFYGAYVDAVNRGEKIFVVEQKTEKFNFFVDLDYKDTEELSLDRLEEICATMCDRVSTFSPAEALVSVAEPKPCGGRIKHGIHVNWSGFVVDHGSAMALHSHIVSALTILFPSMPWNDIVDTSVYGGGRKNAKGSGFRMPWSHKRAKHEACGGAGCAECDRGKVTQGQYRPVFVYAGGALTWIDDREPSVDILRRATLRTEATDHVVVQGSVREEGSFAAHETKDVFGDAETQGRLEAFIQKNMDGQGSTSVTKIFVHDKIHLVSTNSKYCENIKRDHASNHVWFLIEGDGTIKQKCFCRCETTVGRAHGFCRDFSGRAHVLPDKIARAMYPTSSPPRRPPASLPASPPASPVDLLTTFVSKHMLGGADVIIRSLTKKQTKKYTLDTSYACGACGTQNVPFAITRKDIIRQMCKCPAREHRLLEKIVKIL